MSAPDDSFGLLACEAYVPRWRIARKVMSDAVGWSRGRVKAGQGTRSFAGWDEDSLTMAVEAARLTLDPEQGALPPPSALTLASTSLPFAERSHAGIAREVLRLPATIRTMESAGSRRAASSALLRAWTAGQSELLCASDCVDAQPGSEGETELGHGAAALLLGTGKPLAELVSSGTLSDDFVDRYRTTERRFDYRLEARWVRDAGLRAPLGALIAETLEAADLGGRDVDWFLSPFTAPVAKLLARDAGLSGAQFLGELEQEYGLCGTAHPMVLLSQALKQAEPGQHVLLVGAGQGFDVLLLRVCRRAPPAKAGPAPRSEENYTRYLGLRRLLHMDGGLRAERDNRSSQSAAARHHEDLHGLLGGRCGVCGKLQFPRTALCVHCHAAGEQVPEALADLPGEVNSFTEDWLAWTPRPPLIFGNVHFPGSANIMLEFTDFESGELLTGQAVRMAFRIKDFDDKRGFRRYFWKPAPTAAQAGTEQGGAHG